MIFFFPVVSDILDVCDFYFLMEISDVGWKEAVDNFHRARYYERLFAADFKQEMEK